MHAIMNIRAQIQELDVQIAKTKMLGCSHIFVTSPGPISEDDQKKPHAIHTCVACGLTDQYIGYDSRVLLPEENTMIAIYLVTQANGVTLDTIITDPQKAKNIYETILLEHPTMERESVIKCLENTLQEKREQSPVDVKEPKRTL